MIALIRNEIIKQLLSKKVWLFALVIVILGCIQAFILVQDDASMAQFQTVDGQIDYLERQIKQVDESIREIQSSDNLNDQMLASLETQREQYRKEITDLKSYTNYDFNSLKWESKIETLNDQALTYPEYQSSWDRLIQVAKMNQALDMRYNNTHRLNGINFLYQFISSLMSLFMLVGIAFFQADSFIMAQYAF